MSMNCFVCTKEKEKQFTCSCNITKYVCENHVDAIDDIKKACKLKGSCIKCKEYFSHLTIQSNGIQFNVCFDCVLEIIAPYWAEEAKMYDDYFFVEETNVLKV